MLDEEARFAQAFADALAGDLAATGGEPVVRVVLRWFEEVEPAGVTLHVLFASEREAVSSPDEAWYPLEWPNLDREMARTDRVVEAPAVAAAAAALEARYEGDEALAEDAWDGDYENAPIAMLESVRRIPAALEGAGVALDEDFAVSASHFEGVGTRKVLKDVADKKLWKRLKKRGELPEE